MSKKRIWVICGGESAERDVSAVSAKMIFNSLDSSHYEKELIWISPKGEWLKKRFNLIDKFNKSKEKSDTALFDLFSREISPRKKIPRPDVAFPIVHGPLGEDGTLQGLFELLHIPYVGCGVLGSALGMDKEFSKILARSEGIPIVPFFCIHHAKEAAKAADLLGFPVFAKPARLGSSVGISKVDSVGELNAAVRKAFSYDTKVLIEKAIVAREIECAVLGDPYATKKSLRLRASVLGEIAPHSDFYTYETKYITINGSEKNIPAPVSLLQKKLIQEYSLGIFRALDGYGMARVDFFIDKNTRKIYFNEINTLPGFTPTSMYPALWKASGLDTSRLIDILIELALGRARAIEKLKKNPV